MPLVWAVGSTWGSFTSLPMEYTTMFYWWTPDPTFLRTQGVRNIQREREWMRNYYSYPVLRSGHEHVRLAELLPLCHRGQKLTCRHHSERLKAMPIIFPPYNRREYESGIQRTAAAAISIDKYVSQEGRGF